MASVNKVIIVGNLGRDPEMRTFPSGDQVANVTIATTDKWKDKQSGEMREATEWHRVVFNGRLAEIAGQYLRKGSQVYVEGSLRTRKWTDQSGVEKYSTEIRADQMQMLGSRQGMGGGQQGGGGYDDGGYGGGDQGGYDQAPRRAAPAPRPMAAPAQRPAPAMRRRFHARLQGRRTAGASRPGRKQNALACLGSSLLRAVLLERLPFQRRWRARSVLRMGAGHHRHSEQYRQRQRARCTSLHAIPSSAHRRHLQITQRQACRGRILRVRPQHLLQGLKTDHYRYPTEL